MHFQHGAEPATHWQLLGFSSRARTFPDSHGVMTTIDLKAVLTDIYKPERHNWA
jgi:hypothetical protein